jgi:hypothetical protein
MLNTRLVSFGAVVLLAAIGPPLKGQSTTQVHLAFGYECGDRFTVRNDGTEPVLVEYAPAGMQDRSQLHLSAGQTTEIASAQTSDLELWVGGKVVASEPKGNRPCTSGGARNVGGVYVRHLDPGGADAPAASAQVDPAYGMPPVVVYAPSPVYSDAYDYGDYYGYGYYPSIGYYGFGGYGYGYGGYIRGGGGYRGGGGGGRVGGGGVRGGGGGGHAGGGHGGHR